MALALPPSVGAQAPAVLDELNNHVLTMTSALTGGTLYPASAIRFRTNRPPEFSGSLFSVFAPTYGPTNISYSLISPSQGLLRLVRYATASNWETNNVTLNFAAATSGSYSNWILRSGVGFGQSNYGTFTYTAGTNIAPQIIFQSSDQIVQPGDSRSLSVSGVVGFDLAYYWRKDGTNLTGVSLSSSFINLNNIQAANVGNYTCVASNSAGVATSAVMNVSFATPVTITRQPQSVEVPLGDYVTLEAQATGSLQNIWWYKNGAQLTSNTNRLTFPVITASESGSYFVVFDNYGLYVTSQVAVVSIRTVGPLAKWLDRPFTRARQPTRCSIICTGNCPHRRGRPRHQFKLRQAVLGKRHACRYRSEESG